MKAATLALALALALAPASSALISESTAGWPLPNGFGFAPNEVNDGGGSASPPWASVGNHRIEVRTTGGGAVRRAHRVLL